MSTNDVEICNRALTILERKRITGLLEGSPSANDCLAVFEPVKRDLIRSQEWNFATKRAKLAQLAEVPLSEFEYQYQLPTDWLRTLQVSDNDNMDGTVEYSIEGDVILANPEDLYLKYSRDVEDPALFDPLFATLFSWELATEIARTLAEAEMVERKRRKAQNKASSVDGIENFPTQRPVGSWVTTRWNGGRGRNNLRIQ